ncbi:hypothetical protein [Sphingobacterium corticibacter]|uniref:Lipoprotein n=1 Tax=Sphingobacterium corticibacter TaxID=2171749 RepID=A0A2T8HIM5_9SPHI|nr:hypothetical protein [Sphingobacterium corticibacter]PVH25243.1 hypothetical protein DC487_09985 [Sphingobacterium corticibacter]
MNRKNYVLGILAAGVLALSACNNHPREEAEQPRMPEDRTLDPHEEPSSTTDTAHRDTMPTADTLNTRNPAQPNF